MNLKLAFCSRNSQPSVTFPITVAAVCLGLLGVASARGSVAYGSINNFDTVNDSSQVCHGFEIELDDLHAPDITYTYDYNHYGTPKITEIVTNLLGVWHTNVLVRYAAVYTNNAGWSAYTAIPTNAIPPTQGHAFTNPSLNFGGEHFGVGYRNPPTKVYYHWLVDPGTHALALGPQVNVSTPAFTYNPPLAGAPAQVVAVIPAPVLPIPPSPPDIVYEFSDATWVKVITTTSRTNSAVALRELVTPDTRNPGAKDWRNGEPDEVETEWQLLQTDNFSSDYNPTNGVGGKNGMLAGAGKNLTNSDDVVTCRYEYYAYVGPYADLDTHEALAQSVAPNGFNGTGAYSNTVVVGKFLAAQMSAMAAAPPIGLIDHLPDAEVGVSYPTRGVVIARDTNFTATCSGLPEGMRFEPASGWVYETPVKSGVFIVTVSVAAGNRPVRTKNYPLIVAPAGVVLPPHSSVDTSPFPAGAGVTTGDGVYTNGTPAIVSATAFAGYGFLNWTENDRIVGTASSYFFTNIINQSLVANFGPELMLRPAAAPTMVLTWPTNFSGYVLQQSIELRANSWVAALNPITTVGANYQAVIQNTNGTRFYRLMHP